MTATLPVDGPARRIAVGGIVPFTATDYPGALAAVVFCQGCPWRCGYCHNPHLITAAAASPLEWRSIVEWLEGRRGLLDAVVFSGGEPLAQPMLVEAMGDVRRLGFAVGLHTGGAYPRRFAEALPGADWVGFDAKAPRDDYARVTRVASSAGVAARSLEMLVASRVAHEVRTTVHAALTPRSSLVRIAEELAAAGVQRWVLQRFRATGCADEALRAGTADVLDPALVEALSRYVPRIDVR